MPGIEVECPGLREIRDSVIATLRDTDLRHEAVRVSAVGIVAFRGGPVVVGSLSASIGSRNGRLFPSPRPRDSPNQVVAAAALLKPRAHPPTGRSGRPSAGS